MDIHPSAESQILDPAGDRSLESVRWLESFVNFERNRDAAPYGRREYSLDSFRKLLAALGDPQDATLTIHVAGTKGKGSCATLLDRLARAAGLKTGRYTSPHLASYRERIAVAGVPISADAFERRFLDLRSRVESLGYAREKEFRSLFELMTAGAWLHFAEEKVDVAIVEVGLGGRLDATNCVKAPRAALVTSIGLDHTDLLGDTLEAIAREKGGVYKRGCPAIARRQDRPEGSSILAALRERAEAAGASEFLVASDAWSARRPSDAGESEVEILRRGASIGRWGFGLAGEHQRGNLEACLAAFEASRFGPDDDDGWRDLLAKARLDEARHGGRLEVLSGNPCCIADGAHCPLSIRALLAALPEARPSIKRWTVAFGALKTKRVDDMLAALAADGRVEAIIPVPVADPRSLDVAVLAEAVRRVAPAKARPAATSLFAAMEHFTRERRTDGEAGLVATGSLFNVQPAREAAARLWPDVAKSDSKNA